MRIAGWTPLSLSDFPGRVAAVLFAPGCNFRCPFCHNGALLSDAGGTDWEAIEPNLRQRRPLLDGVVFSGGEPTLQPGLADCLDWCQGLGLQTKLDTNGSQPGILDALLDANLLDFVAMDIKAPWDSYARLAGVDVDVTALQESVRRIADSGIEYAFRTTYVPELLTEADMARIRSQLPVHAIHTVQNFRPELALDPALHRSGLTQRSYT